MLSCRSKHMFKMFALGCVGFVTLFSVCLALPQLILDDLAEESPITNGGNLNRTKRARGDCSMALQEFSGKEPLFIYRNQLFRPVARDFRNGPLTAKRAFIDIPSGESLLIACPGTNNNIRFNNRVSSTLSCSNSMLTLDNVPVVNANLSCANTKSGCFTKVTPSTCEGNGRVVELGFEVPSQGGAMWLPQVRVCHNIDEMTTYYSSHTVYGNAIAGAVKDLSSNSFSKGCADQLFSGAPMNDLYPQDNQKKSLDDILGNGAGAAYIRDQEYYLAKGHLAPDADFVSASEQALTYGYVNAAPQWQKLNNGNWKKIENQVRRLADQLKADLYVHTGTHGILKLNYNGVQHSVYLRDKRNTPRRNNNINLPVPEIFWKIVQHSGTGRCVVAVAHNNVHLTATPTHLCPPIRPVSAGWPDYYQEKPKPTLTKGYFYYCDYPSFKGAVANSPALQCTGVL